MTKMTLLAGTISLAFAAPAIAANPVFEAATAARADQLKLLEQVVNIDSGTGDVEGGRKVGAVLEARLKALGASVEMVAAEAPGLPENIVATLRGTGKTRILMIGHLDTVFGPGTVAQRPFRIEGDPMTGRARGPGVGDEKGGVVEAVKALELLRNSKFTNFNTITLLIETSEERGSPGTRKLIDRLLDTADVELNLEPGDAPDKVTVWRKSSTVVTIDVTGKAAHAGVAPQDGHNAAVELLHQLEGYGGRRDRSARARGHGRHSGLCGSDRSRNVLGIRLLVPRSRRGCCVREISLHRALIQEGAPWKSGQ